MARLGFRLFQWALEKQTRWLEALERREADPYRIRIFDGSAISWVLGISILIGLVFLYFSFDAMFGKREFYKLSPEQIRSAIGTTTLPPPQKARPWESSREFRKALGVLHVGMPVVGDSLDPLHILYHPLQFSLHGVYRTLVELDEIGNVKPAIASSWKYSNGNRNIIFELDPTAHFGDGTPITAHDVVYTFSRFFWPGFQGTSNNFLREIIVGGDGVKENEIVSGISAIDDLHVEFKLKSQRPTFFNEISDPICGILPKDRFIDSQPLNSGPVHVHKNVSQEQGWSFSRKECELQKTETELENCLRYIRIFPIDLNIDEAKKKIMSGQLDLIFGFSFDTFKELKLSGEYLFKGVPINSIAHFFYNMNKPLFKEQKFREDFSALIQNIVADYQDPGHIFNRIKTYIPEYLMPATYYERKIKPMNLYMFREKWGNQMPDKIDIALLKNSLEKTFMKKLTSAFSEIGINLTWKEYLDYNAYALLIKKRDYDILFGRYATNSSQVDSFLGPLDQKDEMAYSNADTSELFKKIYAFKALPTWLERIFAYQEAFEEFESKHYVIPLFQHKIPVIAHEELFLGDFKSYDYNHENISYWKMHWKNFPSDKNIKHIGENEPNYFVFQ